MVKLVLVIFILEGAMKIDETGSVLNITQFISARPKYNLICGPMYGAIYILQYLIMSFFI